MRCGDVVIIVMRGDPGEPWSTLAAQAYQLDEHIAVPGPADDTCGCA